MEPFESITDGIRARFDAMDRAREGAIAATRRITRGAGDAIKAMHRGEWPRAESILAEARAMNDGLRASLAGFPEIYYSGYVEDAQAELAEVSILAAVLQGRPMPAPEAIGVENTAYLKGMGDAAGELRRHILDLIRRGKPGEGEKYLDTMDEFYAALMAFDYPDAILHGLRRKTDVARSLVERTRGDLTNALEIQGLHASMEEFGKNLK